MDNVACSGSERTLTACSHITSHNCRHREDAGVRCQRSELLVQCCYECIE